MMSNHLFLNRLRIVTENGAVAYDEQFHKGVNIIRGDNSSGKSTITHFIFYALGGDFSEFVPEARKCATVFAEVEMNYAVLTIKRDIIKGEEGNIKKRESMFFYFGDMNESLNPPADKTWQKYVYNTNENKKSFSNVLFDFLDLPIVKGDTNITFHQVLRLLYIDQDSPTNSLFYYEQFDSQLTRETVSDLLLGVYNEELYEKKRRLNSAEKELDEVKSEIKATKNFLPKNSLAPNFIKAHIGSKEKEIAAKQDEIIAIRQKSKNILYQQNSKLNFQRLTESTIEQRQKVAELEEQISLLHNEIEDSEFFIKTLNKKIEALRNSVKTREFLGHLPLEYCPECLTKIKENEDKSLCKLCKEPIDQSFGVVQAKRMELEIGFQINESQKLIEINKRTLLESEAKYVAELGKLQDIQKQVNAALADVKSFDEETVDELNREKGFLEGEILQFRTILESAELYEKLIDKKNNLEKEIESLKKYISYTEKKQSELKTSINNQIREEGVYLLNNDLDRQDEFKNAQDFFIDYSNNIAFLSNKYSKYSASSNFYLKVSARFALFLASLKIEEMRYPRFVFADNMEDKGIEEKRAQNLQKILIERVNQYEINSFQMIYTTSFITEELNNSPYVVGEYYTKENPSLKNIPKN